MSGKYYVAHIIQFKNRDEKEKYLQESSAIHISTKDVTRLLKSYINKQIEFYKGNQT